MNVNRFNALSYLRIGPYDLTSFVVSIWKGISCMALGIEGAIIAVDSLAKNIPTSPLSMTLILPSESAKTLSKAATIQKKDH